MQQGLELGGRYRLEGLLGRGGMGEVWRGTDLRLRRPVAVKVLPLSAAAAQRGVERFQREAEAAASLNHPGITVVYDIDEHRDANARSLFLVMELLIGRDLSKVLDAHPNGLPVEQVIDLAAQIADALAAAHENGVVHRDIKPANLLLLDKGQRVKICDFGIARLVDATQITTTGAFTGTPLYMAPEQIQAAHVDHRTDLYAFGCVLYELLTGTTWVNADTNAASILYQHVNQQPTPPQSSRPQIPDHLNALILELLAKEPDHRPRDAATVAERLRRPPAEPQQAPGLLPPWPPAGRHPGPATGGPTWTPAAVPPAPIPPTGPRPALPADYAGPGPRRVGRRAVVVSGLSAAATIGLAGVAWWAYEEISASRTTHRAAPSSNAQVAHGGTLGRTLKGHSDNVLTVAFSPDGKSFATGSDDGTARLWNLATGHTSVTFTGDDNSVTSVAFSPDGKTLAGAADFHKAAHFWDVATGHTIATFTAKTPVVISVNYSPDGKMLATGSKDGTVRLWNVATRKPIATLKGHTKQIWSIQFSPDGMIMATGSEDKTVRLWDVATRRLRTTLTGHTEDVYSVAFSADGTTLATASKDGTARLWDVATRETTGTITPKGDDSKDACTSVAFSPDRMTLGTADSAGKIHLWNLANLESIATLKGHTGLVESVAFSPDGKTLGSGGDDNTARLWTIT